MTPLQMALAYALGGVLRRMLVGVGMFVLAIPLAGRKGRLKVGC